MTITWIAPDEREARSEFDCDGCQTKVGIGEGFYTCKSGHLTVRMCEDCTAAAEVEKELGDPDRDEWLSNF